MWKALEAARALAETGVEAEVVDLRVLRPLDDATIMGSVRRTRRAVVVDEGWRTGSLAAEIMARIMEQAFFDLDAPVAQVCSAEVLSVREAPRGRRPARNPPGSSRRSISCSARRERRAMIEFKLPSSAPRWTRARCFSSGR
ncbi:MAG: transketolase C-terminal domain-containing protein [Burkholderiales bacterium]